MPSTAERASQTPFFSVAKTRALYEQQVSLFGSDVAAEIVAPIIAGDIRSIAWEATKSVKPYEHFYYVVGDLEGKKLIHESDLQTGRGRNGKDLLEGFCGGSEDIRRGLEYRAALNYRQAILNAEVGTTTIWVSPKKEDWEDSSLNFYTQSQINIAEKQADGKIFVRQFQSEHLNTAQSAAILNKLADNQVVQPESDLDQILVSVGQRTSRIETYAIHALIEQATGRQITSELPKLEQLEQRIFRLSEVNARNFVSNLAVGLDDVTLEKRYFSYLKQTLGQQAASRTGGWRIVTSCGIIGSEQSSFYSGQPEKWAYHTGDCVNCESRNTKVGPCSICVDCEKVL